MDTKILDIIDMSVEGDGIGRDDENVYFIDGAVEGERVKADIYKQKDNLFWGKLVEIIEPSFRRATPPCPYFDKCGGCKLMHLNPETQMLFKMLSLKRTMKKVTNLDIEVKETVPSERSIRYRNSVQFKVERGTNGEVNIGFYESNSHNLISIDDCLVCDEHNKVLISLLKSYIRETNALIESVFAGFFGDKLSILVQTADGECSKNLADLLRSRFEEVSLWASKQFSTSTLLNYKDAKFIAGSKSLKVDFDGVQVDLTPLDFIQVNLNVAHKIYQDIYDVIGTNKVVLDLYSGLGLTSIEFAKRGNFVCSIEKIQNSVDSAKALAEKLNLNDKIIAHCGDCAEILPQLEFSDSEKANLVAFLDPPRKGAGKEFVDAILALEPKVIIYMSCNPTTLAKDIRDLLPKYKIQSMQAYDMFPQSSSIESLTILTLK